MDRLHHCCRRLFVIFDLETNGKEKKRAGEKETKGEGTESFLRRCHHHFPSPFFLQFNIDEKRVQQETRENN